MTSRCITLVLKVISRCSQGAAGLSELQSRLTEAEASNAPKARLDPLDTCYTSKHLTYDRKEIFGNTY